MDTFFIKNTLNRSVYRPVATGYKVKLVCVYNMIYFLTSYHLLT